MTSLLSFARARTALGLLLLAGGCASGQQYQGPLPHGDYQGFASSVYPVLLRDCGFSECHGAEHRFFQVFGPGRTRLDPTLDPADPATMDEITLSYQRALSMLVTDADYEQSLLLRKPLDLGVGGQGHEGIDALGRNVYSSKTNLGYLAIKQWAAQTAARAGAQ